jgi:uncharacterized protein (DUF1778 family)
MKTETISVRISPEIKLLLKEAARKEHRSMTNMLEKIILDYYYSVPKKNMS